MHDNNREKSLNNSSSNIARQIKIINNKKSLKKLGSLQTNKPKRQVPIRKFEIDENTTNSNNEYNCIEQQSPKFSSFSNDSFKTAQQQQSKQLNNNEMKLIVKDNSNNQQNNRLIDLDPKTQAVLDRKNYRLFELINRGSFGEVYKGQYLKDDHRLVAIKILNINKMSMKFRERYVARELKTLIDCHHTNIIQIFDIIRSNNRLFIFMEFCPNGTMTMFLKKYGHCSEQLTFIWFQQLINALQYLHLQLKIAHRDIKFDNILLDKDYNCKLSDFGFAKELINQQNNESIELSSTICGTQPFMCPQLLLHQPYNAMKADCWAMGIILYGLLNGHFPFTINDTSLMVMEQTQKYPKFITELAEKTIRNKSIIDLLVKILDPNEQTRLTIKEIAEHQWIRSNQQQFLSSTKQHHYLSPMKIIRKMKSLNKK